MQLRKTIYVPVLNDKNLYVFVIGVLARPPVSEENEQKWFQAKNEQISHDDISTCSQCRSFSVRQRVCYDNKMPLTNEDAFDE